MKRSDRTRHWREVEGADDSTYPDSGELFATGASLVRKLESGQLGTHHECLPPGQHMSCPHTESDEEEFIYVLEGYPEVWANGYLQKLELGNNIGFLAGTGVRHTSINNTNEEVRLLVVGEANKKYNRIYYPLNPAHAVTCEDRRVSHPPRLFGSHGGKPGRKWRLFRVRGSEPRGCGPLS